MNIVSDIVTLKLCFIAAKAAYEKQFNGVAKFTNSIVSLFQHTYGQGGSVCKMINALSEQEDDNLIAQLNSMIDLLKDKELQQTGDTSVLHYLVKAIHSDQKVAENIDFCLMGFRYNHDTMVNHYKHQIEYEMPPRFSPEFLNENGVVQDTTYCDFYREYLCVTLQNWQRFIKVYEQNIQDAIAVVNFNLLLKLSEPGYRDVRGLIVGWLDKPSLQQLGAPGGHTPLCPKGYKQCC